jgi:hypothetical protein
MSGIEERIAAVVALHQYAYSSVAWCRCGLNFNNGDEFNAHVASVLVAKLGLTQEWGLRNYIGNNVLWKSADRDEVRAKEADFPDFELVERDVMPWRPDRGRAR